MCKNWQEKIKENININININIKENINMDFVLLNVHKTWGSLSGRFAGD